MRRSVLGLVFLGGARVVLACSSSSRGDETTPDDASGAPGQDAASGSFGSGSPKGDASGNDACAEAAKLVYVIDNENYLRRFDPTTASFSAVGVLDCPAGSGDSPYSMGVDRRGSAWVLFASGHLFKVSTEDASCSPTSFKPQTNQFRVFGMGFATDEEDGTAETLYVSSAQSATLGKIDLTTMKVVTISAIEVDTRIELSGTGSGQLFALLEPFAGGGSQGKSWTVAELSKSKGEVLLEKPQPGILEGKNNFAFAAWGGDFYSFVGNGVYRYDTKASETKLLTKVPFTIVGAGVSTCAPHAVVK